MAARRLKWTPIIERAAAIVAETEAAEGVTLTLRGLFCRLVSEALIPNTKSAYKRLSTLTAQGRREGTFPDLHDAGRDIALRASWRSPADAVKALHGQYRFDRTEGQPFTVILGVEIRHIGLTAEQVAEFDLPGALDDDAARAKAERDARAAGFRVREGGLFQTELEALPTAELHRLYDEALAPLWDVPAFAAVKAREDSGRAQIARFSEWLGG